MALALPGARHLFSHIQHALTNKLGARVSLQKGVHHALEDFRWMLDNIASRPTRIAELVSLLLLAEGHHGASGKGAGGIWFPAPHLDHWEGHEHKPVLWRLQWPQNVIDRLVTDDNPSGDISNSDLELAGGLLHLEALAQTFDIRERTVLSKTDNLNSLFWQRKASATTDKVPAHVLRLFGFHQRYHRYVARHDYQPGASNPIADACSRDFELSWEDLLADLAPYIPENEGVQIWTPSDEIVSAVISALLRRRSAPESLMVEPSPPIPSGNVQGSAVCSWPLTPFSKPSRTKYQTYKSADDEYSRDNFQPTSIQSGLERLKVTYGELHKRPSVWGPTTQA